MNPELPLVLNRLNREKPLNENLFLRTHSLQTFRQPVPQYFITADDFFDFNLVVDQPGNTPVPVLLAKASVAGWRMWRCLPF